MKAGLEVLSLGVIEYTLGDTCVCAQLNKPLLTNINVIYNLLNINNNYSLFVYEL